MPSLEAMKQALLAALAWLQSAQKPPVVPVPPPEPPTPPQPQTLLEITAAHDASWCGGTIEERRAMMVLARQVITASGMSVSLGADMWGTIWGESGWNQYCQNHHNKNGSGDYGIAQFNSNTYLVEFKMTREEALLNPKRCLEIMAQCFKDGRQHNWFGYQPNDPQFQKNRTRTL